MGEEEEEEKDGNSAVNLGMKSTIDTTQQPDVDVLLQQQPRFCTPGLKRRWISIGAGDLGAYVQQRCFYHCLWQQQTRICLPRGAATTPVERRKLCGRREKKPRPVVLRCRCCCWKIFVVVRLLEACCLRLAGFTCCCGFPFSAHLLLTAAAAADPSPASHVVAVLGVGKQTFVAGAAALGLMTVEVFSLTPLLLLLLWS